MIALTTTPKRWTRGLAALLLALQGLAGSAVSLAHASERLSAPMHIEAQHATACVALHDELRCPLCQYAGSQVQSPQSVTRVAAAPAVERSRPRRDAPPTCPADRCTAPPRAPPASRL